MTKRVCHSCRFFQAAGQDSMGWCNHPKRRTGNDVRIYVRSNELPCRNDWAVDLWQPTGPETSDVVLDAVALPVAPATPDEIGFLAANAQRSGAESPPNQIAGCGEDIVLGDLTSLVTSSDDAALEETRRLRKAHEQMRVRNRERRDGVLPLASDPPPLMPSESGLWLTGDLVGRSGSSTRGAAPTSPVTESNRLGPGDVSPVALGEMGRPFPKMTTFPEDDARFSSIPVSVEGVELPLATRGEASSRVVHRVGFEDELEIVPWHALSDRPSGELNHAPAQTDQIAVGANVASAVPLNRRPLDMRTSSMTRNGTTEADEAGSVQQERFVATQESAGASRGEGFASIRDGERDTAAYRPQTTSTSTGDVFGISTGHLAWEETPIDRFDTTDLPLRPKRPSARSSDHVRYASPLVDDYLIEADADDLERLDAESLPIADDDDSAFERWMSLPRMCGTCRDFRPAENGERGWCTNKWAFSHRRMVDAEELPCETSIGGWWLPHDDPWMSAVDVSAHSQPTPLLDLWLAHRAAASGEIDATPPARRRQRS